MEQLFPQVSRALLSKMDVEEIKIFSEPKKTKNAGAPTQSYATRAKIQVTTHSCYVIIPKTNEMFKGILVKRKK